jgi:hypothetical protein
MRPVFVAAAVLATLAFGTAHAHDGDHATPFGPFDPLSGNEIFSASLLGANEVGNPGDANGFGSALISIDHDTNTVNYSLTFANLSTVTAAHIHAGPAGVNGPVKVNFTFPSGTAGAGAFSGSVVDADAEFITALTASNFYVNIHTNEFPGGALRGQLAPVPEPETYALMLAGLGVVGWTARRRRAK